MTQSLHDLRETLMLALGLVALLFAALLSAGVINQKEVRLSPSLERKKILIAIKPLPAPPATVVFEGRS